MDFGTTKNNRPATRPDPGRPTEGFRSATPPASRTVASSTPARCCPELAQRYRARRRQASPVVLQMAPATSAARASPLRSGGCRRFSQCLQDLRQARSGSVWVSLLGSTPLALRSGRGGCPKCSGWCSAAAAPPRGRFGAFRRSHGIAPFPCRRGCPSESVDSNPPRKMSLRVSTPNVLARPASGLIYSACRSLASNPVARSASLTCWPNACGHAESIT